MMVMMAAMSTWRKIVTCHIVYPEFVVFHPCRRFALGLAPARQSESKEMVFSHRNFSTKLLRTEKNTQSSFYTEDFAHRNFYTPMLLHRGTFTHKNFNTHRRVYTQKLFHGGNFTQRRLYTGVFAQKSFTHGFFYTGEVFMYIQKLLDTETFAQRNFYARELSHTETSRNFYKPENLHSFFF